jgi:hypothetical protein
LISDEFLPLVSIKPPHHRRLPLPLRKQSSQWAERRVRLAAYLKVFTNLEYYLPYKLSGITIKNNAGKQNDDVTHTVNL